MDNEPKFLLTEVTEITATYEREAFVLNQPKLLDIICSHVACGGTLIDLCEDWNVRYHMILEWIRADDDRSKKYDTSIHDRDEWTKEKILNEIRKISMMDIRKLYDESGALKEPKDWPEEIAMAISSVESNDLFEGSGKERMKIGLVRKVKLIDKLKAIELLGSTLDQFTKKVNVSGSLSLVDVIYKSGIEEEIADGRPTKNTTPQTEQPREVKEARGEGDQGITKE